MSVFWNAVHTIRAGAYFKNALDSNSNKKAKDQYKKSHKISEKVLLSGIILATSALLLGRACYRAIKSGRLKRLYNNSLSLHQLILVMLIITRQILMRIE